MTRFKILVEISVINSYDNETFITDILERVFIR